MNDLIIGVDGGGSKTHVILANGQGETLVDITGGASAMSPGHAERSSEVIAALVHTALAGIEAGGQTPRVLYVGVAGVGRDDERIALLDALIAHELAEEVVVAPDTAVAMTDALGDGAGIILIAGTGSIAFGRSPAGAYARCGGWGATFGDEGGGAWIGRRALSIVAAATDGREPPTALTGAILTAAQVNEVEDLIPWSIAADAAAFAALAPAVLATAQQDDLRANSLINMAVEELTLHVRALGTRLFMDDRAAFDLALTGGLLSKGSLMRRRLEQRLKTAAPGASVKASPVIPARGAVKAALGVMASTR